MGVLAFLEPDNRFLPRLNGRSREGARVTLKTASTRKVFPSERGALQSELQNLPIGDYLLSALI